MEKNFVSISAVSDREELATIHKICEEEGISFPVVIGYQVSNKSINQGTQNPRQPKFAEIGILDKETRDYGLITAIHYHTKDNSTIIGDLEKIVESDIEPSLALVQFNTLPPLTATLRKTKDKGFYNIFKVAVSNKKSPQGGYSVWKGGGVQDVEDGEVEPLLKQVYGRGNVINYAMFDPSHGTNLDLNLNENSLAIRFGLGFTKMKRLYNLDHLRLVYAGGIKPTNVKEIAKTLSYYFPGGYSIDVESGVRTEDKLDMDLVRGYLVNIADAELPHFSLSLCKRIIYLRLIVINFINLHNEFIKMVKFAHIADVHLGGWKQQPLQDLNFQSFKKSIDICIEEIVDFVLIAGDLFDTAYPPIEILKNSFAVFKKLYDAKIPCFIIAGSHDFSVSGKTFLDVLERSGFCKNVEDVEETEEHLVLSPTIHKNFAIYGYPGRRSGLEVPDLRKVKFNDCTEPYKIFMLHTTLDKVKGDLPVDAIETEKLPKADYYALGHIHTDFRYKNFVYPGPLFPNNFQELEELNHGGFYIVDTNSQNLMKRINIKLKEVIKKEFQIKNALSATEEIIYELKDIDLNDKIILLRIKGELENGKNSDIKFSQIEEFAYKQGAYFLLKNTNDLRTKESEIEVEISDSENIEEDIIKSHSSQNPSKLNEKIPLLINALSTEIHEGETRDSFSKRILEESKKVLEF